MGKIISEDGVSPDPEKTQILQDMDRPETAADLMQFVCAMNWLRSSLPGGLCAGDGATFEFARALVSVSNKKN